VSGAYWCYCNCRECDGNGGDSNNYDNSDGNHKGDIYKKRINKVLAILLKEDSK
jgi:hypothetical protein